MFDQAAKTYDQQFTNSNIGIALRKNVWNYLDAILPFNKSLKVLELNCGTGEDAIRFAKGGHQVTATDISEEMIRVTKQKVKVHKLGELIKPQLCDIKEIGSCFDMNKFDLVFSNFGGLNCLDETALKNISPKLFQLLKPNGRFIAVVMPKFNLWESLYYMSKFKTEKIFQRNTNSYLEVNVGGYQVKTWYYSPLQFARIFNPQFYKLVSKPIGVAIPPSYMENTIGKKASLMNILLDMETILSKINSLAGISDHFIIDLQKRGLK